MNMFIFLTILTQDMLLIREIESPLLAIAHSLEEIWWHGGARNKILFLDPVQRLSIESWHILLVKWCGWRICY